MAGLFNKINNRSIRSKILFFFYGMILVVTITISLYFQNRHNARLQDTISNQHETALQQIVSDITFLQDDIRDISTYLIIDSNLQSLIDENLTDTQDTLYNNNSLSFIYKLLASKSYISSVIIYGNNDEPLFFVYTDQSTDNNTFSNIKETNIYQICKDLKGKSYWHHIDTNNQEIILNNAFDKFALSRVIVNPLSESNYYRGFLTITFNDDVLDKSLLNVINQSYQQIVISDANGNILYSYGNPALIHQITEDSSDTRTTQVTHDLILSTEPLPNTDWTIHSVTDLAYYRESYTSDTNIWLLMILLCIGITLPISLVLTKHLSTPIEQLLRSMKQFEAGDFNASVPVKTHDEIGTLSVGYNKMVSNIKTLIDEVYVLEIREREAELKALQAGINPHFLYNSLDSIYWKALSCHQTDIAEMLFSLSRLFRLSLNQGKDRIRIKDELELVTHYLALQKMRFKEKLTYDMDVAPEVMEQMIPKLIIQPFVENAIIHGIEPLDETGCLSITGSRLEDQIYLKISDNGAGFDLSSEQSKPGYAIENIRERLTFIYGQDFKLTIDSKIGKGTTVQILLPYKGDIHVSTDDYR